MANDWFVECPGCNREVMLQTPYVTEYRDSKFKCRFCDVKGELIARAGQSKLLKGGK